MRLLTYDAVNNARPRSLTASPEVINGSLAMFPASKVLLHNVLKMRPRGLNQLAVVPIIEIWVLILDIRLPCTTTDDSPIRSRDQIISKFTTIVDPVSVRKMGRRARRIFWGADVRTRNSNWNDLFFKLRTNPGSISVCCEYNLTCSNGATRSCCCRISITAC
jgi:hypothetical protein